MQLQNTKSIDLSQEIRKLKGLEFKSFSESSSLYPKVMEFMLSLQGLLQKPEALRSSLSITDEEKEILQRARESIEKYYLDDLSRKLDLIGQLEWADRPLWKSICLHRTLLEVFNRTFNLVVTPFDMERIDDAIRYRAEENWLPREEIPPFIPKEHFWWYPGSSSEEAP